MDSAVDPALLKQLILSVGTHKSDRPLSPIEVAEGLRGLRVAGMTPSEIAERLQLSGTTMIGRFERLLQLAPSIRHLVAWGSPDGAVSFASAYEIARLLHEDQERLAEDILRHDLNKAEVVQVVQRRLRSSTPIPECVKEVRQRRPEVVRKYVFLGQLTSPAVRDKCRTRSQSMRDHCLREAIKQLGYERGRWSGHLGADRFTLIGDKPLSDFLNGLPGGFEGAITEGVDACLS